MKLQSAIQILKRHNEWRRGAEINQEDPKLIGVAIDTVVEELEFMSLKDAYKVLKKNARYSSGNCEGFVYLIQIEELLKVK